MTLRSFLILFFVSSSSVAFSQKCNAVALAYGFTAKASYNKAVSEVQKKLIEQCGGSVNVSATSLYSIEEDETDKVIDSFNESIQLGLAGIIKEFRINEVSRELIEGGQIKTTIEAEGIITLPIASKLELTVDGLNDMYFEGDEFKFIITSNERDAYVYIFCYANNKLDLIYPNQVQKTGQIPESNVLYVPNEAYTLEAGVEDNSKFEELNTFYIIGTTKPVPYNGSGEVTDLISWYNTLPSKGRFFTSQFVKIKRK